MDDGPPALSRRPELRLAPDRRVTLAAAAAAVIAAGAAAATADPAGRLLLIGAALVLAGYTATDLIFSPRITASAAGLVLNAPFVRTRLAWAEVEAIRADARLRLGLRSTTLEVDIGTTIAIFTRRALGMDPGRAAALLHDLDPRGPATGRA